ncbi:MAG: 3-dehydroquinate synthase [Clostridiales bacterium]|nr:3-dehydroquinate synthase [Clostridiales bacterium]
MERLYVNLGENSYDIVFTTGFDGLLGELEKINAPKKLLIVTDTNVEPLYGGELKEILEKNGYDCALYAFEAGEEHKSMDSILGICAACMEHGLDRKSQIIALGGGVVGDMAGFAAAIYMRGISFVQIPTTLLSQSDSSVGGKTGVDFMDSKNTLGAFHQPSLVYINVETLKTLPKEQFVSGMGEVIKHGIIRDAQFFDYITANSEKIKALHSDTLIKMSKTNCAIKAAVVEKDEKESGLRAILNFGHTIGHAIEAAAHFTKTHGECVGLGMRAAAYISKERGMISAAELEKIERAMELYDFKLSCKIEDRDAVYEIMQKDKKKTAGTLKFVLTEGIGSAVIKKDVTREEIYAAMDYIGE